VVGLLVVAVVFVNSYNIENNVAVHVTKKFFKCSPVHAEHQPI